MRVVMRALAFTAGGTWGGFFVLLFLYLANPADGFDLPAGLGGIVIRFPASLLAGAAIGAIAWLGFALGRAHWAYLASRPGHSLYRMPLLTALVVIYLLVGVALGVIVRLYPSGVGASWLTTLILFGPLVLGIPLGSGYLTGYGERPGALASAFLGLVYGPVCAFWLALCAGVTLLVIPASPPDSHVRFLFPPIAEAILLSLLLTALGLAMGVVTACAEGIGLVFAPDPQPAIDHA